jgi:hypothetical protein
MGSPPIHAQVDPVDRFALTVEGRWTGVDTTLRADSKTGDFPGTEVDFESDLGLDSNRVTLGLKAELFLGRKKRHRLAGAWGNMDRGVQTLTATEIRFGDTVFPVDSQVEVDLDIQEYSLSYAFYPVMQKRFALGIGLGARVLDIRAALRAEELGLRESAEVTGPLPFAEVDIRYAFASNWRMAASFGYFTVEIDQLEGSQVLGRLGFEWLFLRNLGLSLAVSWSRLDADVDDEDWRGSARLDFVDVRIGFVLRAP